MLELLSAKDVHYPGVFRRYTPTRLLNRALNSTGSGEGRGGEAAPIALVTILLQLVFFVFVHRVRAEELCSVFRTGNGRLHPLSAFADGCLSEYFALYSSFALELPSAERYQERSRWYPRHNPQVRVTGVRRSQDLIHQGVLSIVTYPTNFGSSPMGKEKS